MFKFFLLLPAIGLVLGQPITLAQNKPASCAANDVQCMFDQQSTNQQLNFRTPTQINERRVDNATTACEDSNSANCQNIDSKLNDATQQVAPVRELRQNRLNNQQ